MFSMSISVIATIVLTEAVKRGFSQPSLMVLAGFLISLIPMTSGHSFLAVCLLAVFIALQSFPFSTLKKWPHAVKNWILFSIPIIVLGLPQSLIFVQRAHQGNFITIAAIWGDYGGYGIVPCLTMWWESLSVFVFIAVAHCWFVISRAQSRLYLPAFGVFIVANFVRFQPGAMDNTKIFLAAWFPLACCAVAECFLSFLNHPNIAVGLISVYLLGLSMFSGALCIGKSLAVPFPIFYPPEWDVGIWAIENTPVDAVFLTPVYPGIPMTSIAGRTALMTFPGWAWTHGIYNSSRTALIEKLWATHDRGLFLENKIGYVFRDLGRGQEVFDVPPWDTGWMKVYEGKEIEVWKVVEPLL
jgi:hypothetical protein